MQKNESVEQLAERLWDESYIVRQGVTPGQRRWQMFVDDIRHWLRSHGIDPTTMKPITPDVRTFADAPEPDPAPAQLQQSMAEYEAGNSQPVQEVIDDLQKPRPAEPVPTDGDRALAEEICEKLYGTPYVTAVEQLLPTIARHREQQTAKDRAEIERLQLQVKSLWRAEELQSQLDASNEALTRMMGQRDLARTQAKRAVEDRAELERLREQLAKAALERIPKDFISDLVSGKIERELAAEDEALAALERMGRLSRLSMYRK